MFASLEPVSEPDVYVLRVHEDGVGFGGPYVASATVAVDSDGVAYLRGMTSASFTKESWVAIGDALRLIDVKRVSFTRRNRDQPRTVTIDLK